MQFCSLKEAWGNESYISENYYQQNHKKLQESFKPVDFKNNTLEKNNKKILNNSGQINKNLKCDMIIAHVLSCPKCSKQIKYKIFGNLYGLIRKSIEEYREPILLVLITIFIILSINLILKIE